MAGRGAGLAPGARGAVRRIPRPMYEPINTAEPSAADLDIDKKLEAFMGEHVPVMTSADLRRREQVLGKIRGIFLQWVIDSALEAGLSEEASKAAGGKIYTSGSYRLRIHEPGSDIDAICVAPQFCTRELFFSELKERLVADPLVANVNAIETAAVPIITFDFDEINIDLGLACLPVPTVPPTLDIDDDQVLDGVDRPTEKCVNGPRVTNMIHRLVPNYDSFLPVVRCVRKWAKARGLYSNKMGYLGGVNFNIMVAFASQMYPNAGPSTLLHRFFKLMAGWNWPNAIQLVQPYDADLGLEVWNARANSWHCMPIITPAYPGMNSSANVSRSTLDVMASEFSRGLEVVNAIIKEKGSPGSLSKLFEPSDFFIRYNHYLAVDMMASSEEEHRAWVGWVESRLRKLVEGLGLSGLPFKRVHLWPKKFEGCVGGGVGGELPAHSVAYFVGLEVDQRRSKEGAVLDVDKVTSRFRMESVGIATSRGFHRPGMDVMSTAVTWKVLPSFVLDSIGGREAAAAERKRRRRAAVAEKKERLAAIAAAAPKPENVRAAKAAAEAAAAAAATAAAKMKGEGKPTGALLLAALLQRCCGCCYDVVLLAFCWYTRISPGQGMQTVPLPHGACQTNSWMLHGCRCSLLWLLAFLFRESDAFFLSAPGRGRHRSRSPIDSGEKGGHVATVQQQQCLLPSHVRRRRFGQRKLRGTEKSSPGPANSAVPGDVETHAKLASLPCDSANVASRRITLPPTRKPRMYLRGSNLRVGQMVQLSPDQARYLVSVMRLREGSPVRVFDGINGEFLAAVCGVQDKRSSGRGGRARRSGGGGSGIDQVELRIECLTRPQPTGDDGAGHGAHVPDVELVFAPIRKQRLKMLVEKAVEIGASRLTPVLTARTQKGAVADASALGKLGIVTAVEAAEQCERMTVPHVGATPMTLASLFQELEVRHTACVAGTEREEGGAEGGGRVIDENGKRVVLDTVFVCKERDVSAPPLLEALAEYARDTGRDICHKGSDGGSSGDSNSSSNYNASAAFLVGPEGGFDPEEISFMAAFPFVRFVSLGPTVLRAETAVVYALSTWSAFWAASRAQNPA